MDIDGLLARMTIEEKVAQLTSLWIAIDAGGEVAPYQGQFIADAADQRPVSEQIAGGMGQFTRPFGSRPVTPADGAAAVNELQRQLVEDTRLGIPAIVHEECLTGFMAHGATTFPSPLNYASTWDPELIVDVGRTIGSQMRSVGVHQGLAPVMDVVRDPRWGRVEETLGEDPLLVGVIGSAYVAGVEAAEVIATLKHFAGYSASEGGRNLAPAHIGPRELADVFLPPFEMAIREGGARSVMNAYQDIDGEPVAASTSMLTGILREQWGFEGIVVADYFSISFLHSLHGVSEGPSQSASLALAAGLDVELPTPDCYTAALVDAVATGLVDESAVDRSVRRVLQVKSDLGLFDTAITAIPAEGINLDPAPARALARRVAERSIVLLKNDANVLPIEESVSSVALIGPNADSAHAVLGNYTFANHVAVHHPDAPRGVLVVTIAEGIRAIVGEDRVTVSRGCEVLGDDRSGFDEAVAAARAAGVAIVVVGDQAGHFGAGTSGEGTDTDDLSLPGMQAELVQAVAASGTPPVVVLVSGRPYAIGPVLDAVPAVVEAWFPGEEAGSAVADVLFGRVNPGGKSPLTFGRGAGQQPWSYLHKALSRRGYARSTTRPVVPFGHGLSYTSFEYDALAVEPAAVPIDGTVTISCSVRNAGERPGDEVVQLYLTDPVASVTRPVQELRGFARVALEPGETKRVRFALHTDLLSFTGVDLRRIVEPGTIRVQIGSSSADIRQRGEFAVVGEVRVVGHGRALRPTVTVD